MWVCFLLHRGHEDKQGLIRPCEIWFFRNSFLLFYLRFPRLFNALYSTITHSTRLVASQVGIYGSDHAMHEVYLPLPNCTPLQTVSRTVNMMNRLNLGAAESNVYAVLDVLFYPLPAECRTGRHMKKGRRRVVCHLFAVSAPLVGCIPRHFSNDHIALYDLNGLTSCI